MAVLYNVKRNSGGLDEQIAAIAARQHGLFGRAQAVALAAGSEAIRWRLRTGRWELVLPKVYRLAGTVETWDQRIMAVCLHWGPGAVASHRAAAKLRGLCDQRHARVEITVDRGRNRVRPRGVVVHRVTEPIPWEDVAKIGGIPVTKPARTLLDLASTEREEIAARFVDDAVRRRLVTLSHLERWLSDPRRKGHRGVPTLRRLVKERAVLGVTESSLESRALSLLREAGLPIPELQYSVEVLGTVIARLDFAYPEQRVAIEVDGFRFHDTRHGFDAERARGNELQALGWSVLRVTAKHLERYPENVLAWVRAALDR
jgi:hypothetical protein